MARATTAASSVAASPATSVRCRRHQPHPTSRRALAMSQHRLVGEPALDVPGQLAARGVAVLGVLRRRFEGDRVKGLVDRRVDRPRGWESTHLNLPEE